MVFLSFMLLFFDRQSGFRATLLQLRGERKVKEEKGSRFSMEVTGTTGVLLCATALIGMLWYRRGVFPATSGAETLLLLAVVIAVIYISLRSNNRFINLRRVLFIVACACIAMATFGLDGNCDVQPILRTPLLGIHVTTIIIAYALLACTAVNAIIALCTKEAGRRAQQALLGRTALPRNHAACHRHFHWRCVGRHFLGALLGMGPQRGMGIGYTACLLRCIPHTFIALYGKAYGVPPILHCGFCSRAVHLLRRELSAWRPSQLYVNTQHCDINYRFCT